MNQVGECVSMEKDRPVALHEIARGVYSVSLGVANVYLIDDDGLVLVDTGSAGDAGKIIAAVRELGKEPREIRHILVTHCHPDHTGNLAALKKITGAAAYMHPLDAAIVRGEDPVRPLRAAPGMLNAILFRAFIPRPPWRIPPAAVEHEILDGDVLPMAGGIRAIHVPGHSMGQLAFHVPRSGGVLIAADAATNMLRLDLMVGYEDVKVGQRSLTKLAGFRFEVACFGHGAPIMRSADERFREKWKDLAH